MSDLDAIGPTLPAVARRAIESFVLAGLPLEAIGPSEMRAAVFVTLRNRDRSLRGCIGSVQPMESDLVRETARSAVLAATRDPRFLPVEASEIPDLRIEVSVLAADEPARDLTDLDPRLYGVIVRDDAGRQGLLLPDIPGIDDAKTQVVVACRKAGIEPTESLTLRRFRVRKWQE